MEKYLGQEIKSLQERELFLKDNATTVENIGYSKPLQPEEIEKLKETLADATIKKHEAEEAKKAIDLEWNNEIKQHKQVISEAADKLRSKSVYVNEPCYKIVDENEKKAGYYNKEGMLVYERTARIDELQPRLFPLSVNTGTNG
jgi:fructose-specific phosphotransferase system component IIB